MKYSAVFFDFDGTVADTLRNITDAFNHTMRHFGRQEFTTEELKRHLGYGVDYLMHHMLPEASEEEIREILVYYRPYYAAHATENVHPYPDILPMLERLHRDGLPMAIVSNKPDGAVQPVSEIYFNETVALSLGETPGLARKPDSDMLVYTADKLQVDLSSCLYVGDTEVDIRTARNAGIDCFCVTWGFRTREELIQAGAQRIADTPEELAEMIENSPQ